MPRLVHLVLATLLFGVPTVAQSTLGVLRGTVTDPSGAPVPRATVTVVNEATGEQRATTTDSSSGRYTISGLPAGTYRVTPELPAFARETTRVELLVSQERVLDLSLSLALRGESADITAFADPVHKENATLGTVLNNRQVASLPLDGRNFLELSLLAPGTTPAPQGSSSSLRGDFALSANGGREDAQAFILDGVYNMDPKLNTPGVRLPVDAIREFEMLTNGYDAAFGRNGGGQVNVVTQSGGNALRGSAYGFVRTKALEARNVFAPRNVSAPAYEREQVGGTLGGPLVRNRTFFFTDYEHTHQREGITRITNVPTAAERKGDFSQSLFAAPVDPQSRQPFANGRIPDFYMNPVGLKIAALYPLPNRSTPMANYVSSPVLRDKSDHFDLRLDQKVAASGSLSARYSFDDRRFFEPFASSVAVPGFGTNVPRRGQNLGVGWTQPVGARIVNEARFAYSRVAIAVTQEGQGRSLNKEVGLPEISSNPRDFGLSQITVTGFSPLGDEFTTPQNGKTDSLQFLDTLSWATASHLVKVGADLRTVRQGAYRDVLSRGLLNFSDRYITGNALADLLLGYPLVTGGATLDNPQQLRAPAWSAFVQDGWRLRRNLTFTAGLRYEYVAPAVDAKNRATLYDPAAGKFITVGTGNMPRGGYSPDRNNWAPRVSLSWNIFADTVIRTGYGVYYNQGALATGEGLYFNAPYFKMTVNVPYPGVPPVTLQNPFPQGYPVTLPTSATAFQRDLQTPWLEHWNVSVQRSLGGRRSIEAAYAGSRGHSLISGRDINQPAPSASTPNLRPNPLQDDITLIESRSRSRYDSLQLQFQQGFEHGVSMLSSYTYGKSLDDASGFFASTGDPNFPQDSRNPGKEYGRSSFDIRQRFSTSFSAELPFGDGKAWLANKGVLSSLLSGMELQGILTFNTGRPFTVALLPEFDNSNTGRSTLGFGANDRPNIVGTAKLENPTADRWFNTSAFSIPSYGSFGNAGRNILDGPGYQNINLGVLKHIALPRDAKLQLRAEAFNLFNHSNFNLPDAYVGSPTFGRVVSADSPRRCQFGLKLIF